MIAEALTEKIWIGDLKKGPKLEESFTFYLLAQQKYCPQLRDKGSVCVHVRQWKTHRERVLGMLLSLLDHTNTHTLLGLPIPPGGSVVPQSRRPESTEEHIKQQEPKHPFWQVQTSVKGNTDPFVCHLWCQEASPMDLNSMLHCSPDSSSAVLTSPSYLF